MKTLNIVWKKPIVGLGALAFLSSPFASHAAEISDGLTTVPLTEIQLELGSVPAAVRESMTRDQMARFVSNVLLDRRIETAAKAAGTADLPEVRASIARATRDVVVRAYVDAKTKQLSESLPNLEGLARERYEANKASYAFPEAILVAHILLRVNEEDPQTADAAIRAKAEAILVELRGGADFGALAEKHSEDVASARSGGRLSGWQAKGRLVPPFEAAAYALAPGEISGVVRSRFGYHIIKLLDKREATQKPFEDVKGEIVNSLRNEFLKQERAQWMKQFDAPRPIVLDDATFETLIKP